MRPLWWLTHGCLLVLSSQGRENSSSSCKNTNPTIGCPFLLPHLNFLQRPYLQIPLLWELGISGESQKQKQISVVYTEDTFYVCNLCWAIISGHFSFISSIKHLLNMYCMLFWKYLWFIFNVTYLYQWDTILYFSEELS